MEIPTNSGGYTKKSEINPAILDIVKKIYPQFYQVMLKIRQTTNS
jgi:hypothetical protein